MKTTTYEITTEIDALLNRLEFDIGGRKASDYKDAAGNLRHIVGCGAGASAKQSFVDGLIFDLMRLKKII